MDKEYIKKMLLELMRPSKDDEEREILAKKCELSIRRFQNMSELEKNSFVKMFNDGWCATCSFDSAKCAEQHECEAFKIVDEALNKGDDEDGKETV